MAGPGRPKGILATAQERASGYGRTGFCKICAWPGAAFLNAKVVREAADGHKTTGTEALAFARSLDPDFRFDRHVFYTHVGDHLTSPLVSAADRTRKEGPQILPKTNREGLEMIRDVGMKNIMDHPENITAEHTIRAIDVMEKKSAGPETLWVLLARVQAGESPELIMGEYTEMPKQIETQEEATQQ